MKKYVFLIIFLVNFLFSIDKGYKVYDCFPFFNELDILEIRLNELNDVVDYFVLVENPLTFSGVEKPLFYNENKKRFEKFSNKIIHIIGEQRFERPKDSNSPDDNWYREKLQRNDILIGLKNANDEDIVMISDLDEIPRKEKVLEAVKEIKENKKEAVRFDLKMFRYFFNRHDSLCPRWYLSIASSFEVVKRLSPEFMRTGYKNASTISDAGWHFTDMGGMNNKIFKINSWSHQEKNTKHNKDPYTIMKKARKGKKVKIDDTYPKFILENIKYFRDRNYIDDNLPIRMNLKLFNKREKALENAKK